METLVRTTVGEGFNRAEGASVRGTGLGDISEVSPIGPVYKIVDLRGGHLIYIVNTF